MKIFHLPKEIKSLDEVVDISFPVSLLGKFARKHPSLHMGKKEIVPNEYDDVRCAQCGGGYGEIHHKKPVWAHAVEFILTKHPLSNRDAFDIALAAEHDDAFWGWHSMSNLVPLCGMCHNYWQVIDDAKWRISLAEQYRLVYKVTWCDPLIRMVRGKRQEPSLADYVDDYLVKQKNKLEIKLSSPGVQPYKY